MVTEKDRELITFLLGATLAGQLRWVSTAKEDQFTASLKGKYNITVERARDNTCRLRMVNAQMQEMLFLTSNDEVMVDDLFEASRRAALNVDAAIDEIIDLGQG